MFRDELLRYLDNGVPDLNEYRQERENVDRVQKTWMNAGSCLNQFAEMGNPFPSLINQIKVDYRTGGLYTIKRVKSIETPNIYMDFQIMIASIDDRDDHQKLLRIHNM